MLQSMTGYGKAAVSQPAGKITVEIKSLNSKSLDLIFRVPSAYREKELELRNFIAGVLVRGKVEVGLFIDVGEGASFSQVNTPVIRRYMGELRNIADASDLELLKMAIRLPDGLKTDREEANETEYSLAWQALKEAVAAVINYRMEEGKALEKDILLRLNNLQLLLETIEKMETGRLPKVRERLEKTVSEIQKGSVDETRLEQELIYYIEKYDITEEKVRLANHLDYFKTVLEATESNGKKLGFICQEIGREINTIGSKAYDAALQKLVVEMKDELEKIKEQLLNVL